MKSFSTSLRRGALAGCLAAAGYSSALAGCRPPVADSESTDSDQSYVQTCTGAPSSSRAPLEPFVGDFKAGTDYLEVWNGERYVRTFLKGVNLGRGVPGAFPGDFASNYDQYLRWFDKMGTMGVNLLRVYSLHKPAFFHALATHNCANQDHPIYLMQGVGLPNDPDETSTQTLDLYGSTTKFEQLIDEAIDAVHGNIDIPERSQLAYGDYRTDVSHWTLGFLVGREVISDEVLATDLLHKNQTSFAGTALALPKSNPTSVWITAQLDHAIATERTKYSVTRPVAWTNWLPTDPLHHPTEGSKSGDDVAIIDTSKVDASLTPTGIFASFHVYPYAPDFMSEDPGYQAFWSDGYGSDSYRGYLHDLKGYHGTMPVLVAEFGVPTSWGIAHYTSNGMNHGGHTEEMQAQFARRMVNDIFSQNLAGAVYFAWMDEWFKNCWITNPLAYPQDSYPKWHDLTNPQQSYGVVAFDLGTPDYGMFPSTAGPGRVKAVATAADAEFYWVKLTIDPPLADGESFTMGYDTYRDDLGESLLPDGTRTKRRSELALTVTAPAGATLQVTQAYDLYGGHDKKMPYSALQSVPSDDGAWVSVRRNTASAHQSDDGKYVFPSVDQPLGDLTARRAFMPAGTHDAVVIDGTSVEIRVPWNVLQFADPTTFSVVHDDPTTPELESQVTDGIALAISLDGELLETNRRLWPATHGAPKTTERYKPVAWALADAFSKLPTTIP